MPSFYFEQVLQTALNGIDQNVTGPVLQLAGVILILSLLYAVYEAYSNGGDVRALGVAGIKYLVLGLVFINYQQAFRSVNAMFNGVADFISNAIGVVDEVGDTVEHRVHGPECLLVVDEDQAENQVLDPRYSKRSYVAAIAICFVDRVQETQDEDHARELQHRPGDVLVDSIEGRLEHLLE